MENPINMDDKPGYLHLWKAPFADLHLYANRPSIYCSTTANEVFLTIVFYIVNDVKMTC